MAKRLKLENLTKSTIWTVSESELSKLLADARRDEVPAEEMRHYMNIIRPVFDVQYVIPADEDHVAQLEGEHYDMCAIPQKEESPDKEQEQKKEEDKKGIEGYVAVRKRAIKKVTDLTMENVQHLSASELLALIDKNLGTGWVGLPLSIQDIILSAFYVDCSTMPEATLHRKGGLVQRRKEDDYEVLEIKRGTWVEAIFMKAKPKVEKVRFSSGINDFGEDSDKDIENEEEDVEEEMTDDDMLDEENNGDEDAEMEEEETSFEDLDVIDEDSMADNLVDDFEEQE